MTKVFVEQPLASAGPAKYNTMKSDKHNFPYAAAPLVWSRPPEIRQDCNGAENCILSTRIRFPGTKHEIRGSVQEGINGNWEMWVGSKKTAN